MSQGVMSPKWDMSSEQENTEEGESSFQTITTYELKKLKQFKFSIRKRQIEKKLKRESTALTLPSRSHPIDLLNEESQPLFIQKLLKSNHCSELGANESSNHCNGVIADVKNFCCIHPEFFL